MFCSQKIRKMSSSTTKTTVQDVVNKWRDYFAQVAEQMPPPSYTFPINKKDNVEFVENKYQLTPMLVSIFDKYGEALHKKTGKPSGVDVRSIRDICVVLMNLKMENVIDFPMTGFSQEEIDTYVALSRLLQKRLDKLEKKKVNPVFNDEEYDVFMRVLSNFGERDGKMREFVRKCRIQQ